MRSGEICGNLGDQEMKETCIIKGSYWRTIEVV